MGGNLLAKKKKKKVEFSYSTIIERLRGGPSLTNRFNTRDVIVLNPTEKREPRLTKKKRKKAVVTRIGLAIARISPWATKSKI